MSIEVGLGRQKALRLAVGVTACFVAVEALKWDATFLAPLLAAQMLIKLDAPPSPKQGVGLLAIILSTSGLVLCVATVFLSAPAVLLLALALLLYLSFYAHRRGAPELPTLLLQISTAAFPVLAVASPDLAGGFAATLLIAGAVALGTVWLAFSLFPDAGVNTAVPASPARVPTAAARGALRDALVLLPALTWLILDASELAVVILIVIVNVLRQPAPSASLRAGMGLIVGNLLGGVAAAITYNLVVVGDSILFLAMSFLIVSLIFAGQMAARPKLAPLLGLAFSTFILLLGLGLSPLPGGSEQAFVDRLINVFLATAYAVGAIALFTGGRTGPAGDYVFPASASLNSDRPLAR